MHVKGLFFLLILAGIVCSLPPLHGSPDSPELRLYRKADSLLNIPVPTAATNKAALDAFNKIIAALSKQPVAADDTLLFLSYRNKGILMEIDANYPAARDAYSQAISVKPLRNVPADSLVVMTYINLGSTYYYLNDFDSATYFLLRSDSLMSRFPDLEYKIRLYNTLGVLYHDNGNYVQCKNYFSQALEIIKSRQPFDTISAVSVEINIATSLLRTGRYEEALERYRKMLAYNLFNSHIYMNMGKASNSLNKPAEALTYYRKVNAEQIPWVYNELGYTHLLLGNSDSAAVYLAKPDQPAYENRVSLADKGINKLYKAEWLINKQEYLSALDSLQRAIILFSGEFTKEDIFSNPTAFTGSFGHYRLFTALSKKASTFRLLYEKTKDRKYIKGSFDTYESALSLLGYIERSFETDDAKVFLKNQSRHIYEEAFAVCIQLAAVEPSGNYLREAFLISERNRASIMVSSLQERTIKRAPGINQALIQQEKNTRFNIARLSVQSDRATNENDRHAIAQEQAKLEIELARIRKKLEQNSHFYRIKYDDSYPAIDALQKALGSSEALISFYTAQSQLHAFVITGKQFLHAPLGSISPVTSNINEWLTLIRNTESGRKFVAGASGSKLYASLVAALPAEVNTKEEWIIVPDWPLSFLPFESLPVNDGYLVESRAISYNFSCRFITRQTQRMASKAKGALSFAPFVNEGINFKEEIGSLNRLPASAGEIEGLKGKTFLNEHASKRNFLSELNKYPVVHLATHAIADTNSEATFIAFYPEKKSVTDDCLFLDELYSLNMDSTELVIISACETGVGQLVNNEGVISLARAFIYAGCPSTVNSLWKADDNSTAMILRKFHAYLGKGYSKSKALQQAKLDYLKEGGVPKGPGYWSHLVVMGNAEALYKTNRWPVYVSALIAGLFVLGIVFVRKRKRKSRRFP
jgi:CHAT domain-containing protein